VLGLIMVALGKPAYEGLHADLSASEPEHLAAIANQSYGQVILHTAFEFQNSLAALIPQDLGIYFAEMQRANHTRNQQAVSQLREIAQILRPRGISVLALKGAADVLNPIQPVPSHRYISDLDLLIPADRVQEAAQLLRSAKGLPTDDHLIQPSGHHHLSQINPPDWLFTVELHIAPGSAIVSSVLGADMFDRAHPTGIEQIFLPCLEDRFLHHILHGMELRHETGNLNLRLIADHVQYLETLSDQTQKQALNRLKQASCDLWLTDLTELTQGLSGVQALTTNSWGARALTAFGNPEAAKSRDNAFWVRHYLRRLMYSADYRRQTLRKIVRPKAWAEFFAFHRDRRGKFK
jgi:hypothetical protein